MTEASDHPVLEERVKPALLNPPVKPVAPPAISPGSCCVWA